MFDPAEKEKKREEDLEADSVTADYIPGQLARAFSETHIHFTIAESLTVDEDEDEMKCSSMWIPLGRQRREPRGGLMEGTCFGERTFLRTRLSGMRLIWTLAYGRKSTPIDWLSPIDGLVLAGKVETSIICVSRLTGN